MHSSIALATPPATPYPLPAPVASFILSIASTLSGNNPLASNIPASSSKVITKSTSERTVRLEASSFLDAHGPINTTPASG